MYWLHYRFELSNQITEDGGIWPIRLVENVSEVRNEPEGRNESEGTLSFLTFHSRSATVSNWSTDSIFAVKFDIQKLKKNGLSLLFFTG